MPLSPAPDPNGKGLGNPATPFPWAQPNPGTVSNGRDSVNPTFSARHKPGAYYLVLLTSFPNLNRLRVKVVIEPSYSATTGGLGPAGPRRAMHT